MIASLPSCHQSFAKAQETQRDATSQKKYRIQPRQVTCGLQYSSSQLKAQADSSAKLDTDMKLSNDMNRLSIIC